MSGDSFGRWLQRQLDQREWRAADLARRLEVRPGVVSHWLRGERTPSPSSVDKIADVFGLSVDTVLTVAGHRPAVEPLDPDDPRELVIQRLRRMPPEPVLLDAILGVMDAFEKNRKRRAEREGTQG